MFWAIITVDLLYWLFECLGPGFVLPVFYTYFCGLSHCSSFLRDLSLNLMFILSSSLSAKPFKLPMWPWQESKVAFGSEMSQHKSCTWFWNWSQKDKIELFSWSSSMNDSFLALGSNTQWSTVGGKLLPASVAVSATSEYPIQIMSFGILDAHSMLLIGCLNPSLLLWLVET